MPIEKWEEEFCERFTQLKYAGANEYVGFKGKPDDVIDFIETLLSRQKQELLGNGVSQWKNYGIEKGYWAYFKQEIKDELLEIADKRELKELRKISGKIF